MRLGSHLTHDDRQPKECEIFLTGWKNNSMVIKYILMHHGETNLNLKNTNTFKDLTTVTLESCLISQIHYTITPQQKQNINK